MNEKLMGCAEILWEYMMLHQPLHAADCLLVLGSRDDRVAICAARLSREYNFTCVVITGGLSHTQDLLATKWGSETEVGHFSDVYKANHGRGEVIIEREARNTGQNASFSYELLKIKGIEPRSLMIVTKPYMERRALATFEAQWPQDAVDKQVTSSAEKTLTEYCSDEQPIEIVITIMVGDLQRIIEYPKQGLQTVQVIPRRVLGAYHALIAAGYTQHLIK